MLTVNELIDSNKHNGRTFIVCTLEGNAAVIYDDVKRLADDFGECGISNIEDNENGCITVSVSRNVYTVIFAQAYESYSVNRQINDARQVLTDAVTAGDINMNEALMILEDLGDV